MYAHTFVLHTHIQTDILSLSYLFPSSVLRAREWPGNTIDTDAPRCCKRTCGNAKLYNARRLHSGKISNYQNEEEKEREKVCVRVGGSSGLREPVLPANLNDVLSISLSSKRSRVFRDCTILRLPKFSSNDRQIQIIKNNYLILFNKNNILFKNLCIRSEDRRCKKKKIHRKYNIYLKHNN